MTKTPKDDIVTSTFRWRGGNPTRIEALSDGVFALAIALLAFAQRAPSHYDELVQTFRELPAFALCFLFLIWCWYEHYRYFRRYGLVDVLTITINGALLMLLLFFVHPLKFLSNYLITGPFFYGGIGRGPKDGEVQFLGAGYELMVLYTGAFVAIFLCYLALYWNAYAKRERLELDAREVELTLIGVRAHAVSVGIGALAFGLALGNAPAYSGMTFFLLGPAQGLVGWWSFRRMTRLAEAADEQADERSTDDVESVATPRAR